VKILPFCFSLAGVKRASLARVSCPGLLPGKPVIICQKKGGKRKGIRGLSMRKNFRENKQGPKINDKEKPH